MWIGWDLTVFQSFFKVSGEKLCFQEMFLWSTGGDELRTQGILEAPLTHKNCLLGGAGGSSHQVSFTPPWH